jgi:16S rRNA pseudouridine516 synthase
MMHAVGNEVLTLHRTQIGPLVLDRNLQPGEHRALTKEEVIAIKSYQKT